MKFADKVLLVGWDSADWKVIHPLMEAGRMPHLQRLVENGAMAQLATIHPALSPMLWTSIATGKRPFQHGIHGFSEPTPDGRAVQPVTNLSRKCKAVWNILQQNGLRSNVVGWWPSHPAEPINGVMVSDQYHRAHGPLEQGWPLRPGAVHPSRLMETMAELRMHPDELIRDMLEPFVPLHAQLDPAKDRLFEALCKTLCECVSIHSAATWLLENEPWDFCAVYYDAIDHFSHGFMKYHPPRQEWVKPEEFELYQGVVAMAYQFHDQMLGRLLQLAGDDAHVIVMSDHGFHSDHLRPKVIPDIPAGPAIEHRDFGILVVAGEGIQKDALIHGASVLDITPTLLTLFGLPVGEDMDGKVLLPAFETPPVVATIPSWENVPGDDGRHPPSTVLDPVGAKESLDQLVALGYIERPDDDTEKAVAGTIRELKYNLCESYQDASRHREALEVARELHDGDPDEQRFAVKRFVSCQALGYVDEMRRIVEDLDGRRRGLYVEARARLAEYRTLARQRIEERRAGDGPLSDEIVDTLARQDLLPAGAAPPERAREPIFTPEEQAEFRKWSNLARFQPPLIEYLKAQVLTADRQWHSALECLGRIEEAHMVRPGLLLQAAQLYGRLNRWQDAQRTYEQALTIDPDNPHAHLGLCRVALRDRQYEKAAELAFDCLERLYQYPMAHFLLAVALTGAGYPERAAEALRVALSINPNFPQAHVRLAWLLKHKLNDPAGARTHMLLYREMSMRLRPPATERVIKDTGTVGMGSQTISETVETPVLPALGDSVVVVSGLPRSGTSMVMQMLAAGGLPVLTDAQREADEDNPLGYWEFEPVRQGHSYREWIDDARGKAVKVVAPLAGLLPPGPSYRVVFIERDLNEVLSSQATMIQRRGEPIEDSPARRRRLRAEFVKLVDQTKSALRNRDDVHLLTVQYADVLRDGEQAARRINAFCGDHLSEPAMVASIRPQLHRQRTQ